jgi:hypothetical protein
VTAARCATQRASTTSTATQETQMSDSRQAVIDAVTKYGAAWNSTDPERRRALLEQAFAEDGVFVDPLDHVVGREALLAHMDKFHRERAGCSFEFISAIDVHHNRHRCKWRMRGPTGAALLEATNFGETNENGQIVLMVDFFGPLPSRAD